MRAMLQSDSSFRQFYEFMFEWAKGRDRKILDKKMAISMFPLLLGDKTIYMAEWTGFLEVRMGLRPCFCHVSWSDWYHSETQLPRHQQGQLDAGAGVHAPDDR